MKKKSVLLSAYLTMMLCFTGCGQAPAANTDNINNSNTSANISDNFNSAATAVNQENTEKIPADKPTETEQNAPAVYMTTDISAEGLMAVYAADDGGSLIKRIESRNGLHTLEHAEKIGLGSRDYQLVSIDE